MFIISDGIEWRVWITQKCKQKKKLDLGWWHGQLFGDQLMENIHKWQKIGGIFTKTTYAIVAQEIKENFELSCNFEHRKNRMKT